MLIATLSHYCLRSVWFSTGISWLGITGIENRSVLLVRTWERLDRKDMPRDR